MKMNKMISTAIMVICFSFASLAQNSVEKANTQPTTLTTTEPQKEQPITTLKTITTNNKVETQETSNPNVVPEQNTVKMLNATDPSGIVNGGTQTTPVLSNIKTNNGTNSPKVKEVKTDGKKQRQQLLKATEQPTTEPK